VRANKLLLQVMKYTICLWSTLLVSAVYMSMLWSLQVRQTVYAAGYGIHCCD